MNDINETREQILAQIQRMSRAEKDQLLFELNAGNLSKQQYLEGLEDLVTKLKAELQIRTDSGKEFREHLRNCNGETYRLKEKIKEIEDVLQHTKSDNIP